MINVEGFLEHTRLWMRVCLNRLPKICQSTLSNPRETCIPINRILKAQSSSFSWHLGWSGCYGVQAILQHHIERLHCPSWYVGQLALSEGNFQIQCLIK
jgi:hypothetical protein